MANKIQIVIALCLVLVVGLCLGMPNSKCPNGEPYYDNVGGFDEDGCLIGYCSKVCRPGAITNNGRRAMFRGNKGPDGTGSNGNAGPVDQNTGLAIDPAAETYKKQIAAYQEWAERQNQNAERQIQRAEEQQARQRVRVPPSRPLRTRVTKTRTPTTTSRPFNPSKPEATTTTTTSVTTTKDASLTKSRRKTNAVADER